MRAQLFKVFVVSLALGALAVPARADTSFGVGSLILPTNSVYQDDCGSVAVYGLVYNLLRANPWLKANGYGQIEVYYAYKETKLSPNRCTPTNLHKGAAYPASVSGQSPTYAANASPTHSDAKWNDGCDFEIVDNQLSATASPIVKLVNKSSTATSSDTIISTIDTTAKTTVFPQWNSQQIKHTTTATTNVTYVRYSGGPFIINDADAPAVLKLLDGTLVANDKADGTGNTISFTNFKNTASCTIGSTLGGNVAIHRAYVPFSAPTPKIFTNTPPRLALLARDKNGKTGTINDGILQTYLNNAGLNFTGAQGCPSGGVYASNTAVCPAPNYGSPGQIYDVFDFQDIVDNKISATSGGKNVYKMLWAPHWDLKGATVNSDESNAFANMSSFLNGSTGFMAECASIESIEGAQVGYGSPTSASTSNGQYQTCVKSGSTSTCSSSSTTTYGITKNSLDNNLQADPSGILQNCTDMNNAAGADCVFYSYPGDPFSQVADYKWNSKAYSVGSQVADFTPNTANSAIYRPGVLPLISGVTSLVWNKVNTPATARAMIKGDYVTRNNKDNDPAKANILYLGGHDLTTTVSGTKVVLQTLLQLGDTTVDPTTVEISRATPILATIEGTEALVQGSLERVTPAGTTLTYLSSADTPNWRFPDIKGHMRAVATSNVSNVATAYASNPAIFDAATNIPSADYTNGCSAPFTGTCRTIWTNTTGGGRGTTNRVLFQASNVATLGAKLGLTATEWPTLISRVLAGIETVAGSGSFTSKLGGVDRSSVAVIPASTVAGTARPTMIYFGATDGMLHAVCGSLDGDCTSLGREMWAYVPRTNLPRLRYNTARVDGSPRVLDIFGDFAGTGVKTFKTVLLFETGSGAAATVGETPSVIALDVTDPENPSVLWDYVTVSNTLNAVDLGQGLVVNAGKVNISGVNKYLAFVQTNNGGNGGAGSVVTAIDIETGAKQWQTDSKTSLYPAPRLAASGAVPASGVPGGVLAVDETGGGYVTNLVIGTLYGDLWKLDPATGNSRYGTIPTAPSPLFRLSTDLHPFGSVPALYSNGGALYAVAATGGYADPAALALWTTTTQYVVSVLIATPTASAPLNQSSSASYVPWVFTLTSGDHAFAQAVVIGGEVFVTADSLDVNSLTYGTTGATSGHLYKVNLATGAGSSVAITGGATSIANSGTTLYTSSADKSQESTMVASGTTGTTVNSAPGPKVSRRLWLRTQ